jgi:hypothetical protein
MSYGTTKHTLVSFHMVSNFLGLGGGVTSLCMYFNHGNQIVVVKYYGGMVILLRIIMIGLGQFWWFP